MPKFVAPQWQAYELATFSTRQSAGALTLWCYGTTHIALLFRICLFKENLDLIYISESVSLTLNNIKIPFSSSSLYTIWSKSLIASLICLDLACVIGPPSICKRSLKLVLWSSSFPLSSKEFILESTPTSKRKRSNTLNVALTLYSPGKLTL